MAKTGRPCKFNQRMRDRMIALAGAGKTNEQIAEDLGVATSTVYLWLKTQGVEFSEAIKDAKGIADDMVEAALFSRALGSKTIEKKPVVLKDGDGPGIFTERVELVEVERELPPDPTSCIFWLKNRRPDKWRDRIESTGETIDEIEFIDNGEVG